MHRDIQTKCISITIKDSPLRMGNPIPTVIPMDSQFHMDSMAIRIAVTVTQVRSMEWGGHWRLELAAWSAD
jgi:hypothetical protein